MCLTSNCCTVIIVTVIPAKNRFALYIDGKISRLPWCESSILLETVPLKKRLIRLNKSGFLTINSQPRVNGASSNDEIVGWGESDGYVYQKAYVEFFASPERIKIVKELAKRREYKVCSRVLRNWF